MLHTANACVCVRGVYNSVHGENLYQPVQVQTTAFKDQKDLFPGHLENPQQNLPKFFCSEN